MKTFILSLLTLTIIVVSAQTLASGLTYDPYEIYYGNYYGVGVESTTPHTQEEMTSNGSYADYYNTYYGIDTLVETHDEAEVVTSAIDTDMANPMNFYNW